MDNFILVVILFGVIAGIEIEIMSSLIARGWSNRVVRKLTVILVLFAFAEVGGIILYQSQEISNLKVALGNFEEVSSIVNHKGSLVLFKDIYTSNQSFNEVVTQICDSGIGSIALLDSRVFNDQLKPDEPINMEIACDKVWIMGDELMEND